MILADTSIWVEHLRFGNTELAEALDRASVFIHPFIVGELACGVLRKRAVILGLLARLPSVPTATHGEVLELIEKRELMGRGIGYVDVHLLAGTALSGGVRLWTRDRRLAQVAGELGLAHRRGR